MFFCDLQPNYKQLITRPEQGLFYELTSNKSYSNMSSRLDYILNFVSVLPLMTLVCSAQILFEVSDFFVFCQCRFFMGSSRKVSSDGDHL